MTKDERDRALLMIGNHIEEGKQLIRDKRVLIEILEKEANRLTSLFNAPWKSKANEKRLDSVYSELGRADYDINLQRTKNTKLRNLREEITLHELESPGEILLLTERLPDQLIVETVQ